MTYLIEISTVESNVLSIFTLTYVLFILQGFTMIRKAAVGAAMMNWRYVGKTFVNRDLVRDQIYKEGPNTKPYRYIELHDICRWTKAPKDALSDGRVVWLSKDGKSAKVSYVNRFLRKVSDEALEKEKDMPTHIGLMKNIPIVDLTLLDINGNAVENIEVLYTKAGDPMRVSEKGVAVPYQDYAKKKSTFQSDTTERNILKYGKHIAEMQDVDESIVDSLGSDLELQLKESKIKTYWHKSKGWVTKGALAPKE